MPTAACSPGCARDLIPTTDASSWRISPGTSSTPTRIAALLAVGYILDEIPNYHNALALESLEDLRKPVHTNTPETIDSTAVSKLSATKCGC